MTLTIDAICLSSLQAFRPKPLMLARQWSLRRSGAAASAEGGLPRVQECFRLHLNAVGSGVAIVQVTLHP